MADFFELFFQYFEEVNDGPRHFSANTQSFLSNYPGCDRPIFRVQLFLSRFEEKLDFWKSDSMSNLAIF